MRLAPQRPRNASASAAASAPAPVRGATWLGCAVRSAGAEVSGCRAGLGARTCVAPEDTLSVLPVSSWPAAGGLVKADGWSDGVGSPPVPGSATESGAGEPGARVRSSSVLDATGTSPVGVPLVVRSVDGASTVDPVASAVGWRVPGAGGAGVGTAGVGSGRRVAGRYSVMPASPATCAAASCSARAARRRATRDRERAIVPVILSP